MSYLHCPTCHRAYNIALSTQCPSCPVPVTEVDATEDIVIAAEQLARALARATPAQRDAAAARMDLVALLPVTLPPDPVPKPQPMLAAIAYAVVERLGDKLYETAPRLMARLPSRVRRVGRFVRGALAA